MAASGTYDFGPALSELVLSAFARIGLRRSELTQQHLADAATESNLVLVQLSNHQPNLWTSGLVPVPLVAGTSSYTLPIETVALLAVYMTVVSGSSSNDRILGPISTVEYAAFPNKSQSGVPSTFWFDRQIQPEITLWPVPDGTATYTLNLQTVRQVQDAALRNGQTLDIPYRFYDAFVASLAHRLSRIYAPALEAQRASDAKSAWQEASTQDQEDVPMYIVPGLSSYTRY